MKNIESIIENAYKNNKTINLSDIMNLNLDEEAYLNLMNLLKQNGIAVLDETEKVNESENELIPRDMSQQYYNEIKKIPLLTPAQEKELFEEYQKTKSKKIREKIASANLKLVVSIASKYYSKIKLSTNDMLDAIQDGNEGLLKAIEKYDVSLGYKFSTYATWWIRQSISRSLDDTGRSIRIPVHMMSDYNKIKKTKTMLLEENGIEPTSEELSQILDMPVGRIEFVMKKVESPMISLDEPFGEDGSLFIGEYLKYDEKTVEEIIEEEDNAETIKRLINEVLNPKEIMIISCRYGIVNEYNNSANAMTLEEIAKILGLTRERIRQIEYKALKKIRFKMRGFFNEVSPIKKI